MSDRSIEDLLQEIEDLKKDVIHWRGMTRILNISWHSSQQGTIDLVREEADRYRKAAWVLAGWIYSSTSDRSPEGITPDSWVRWAIDQVSDPRPPPVIARLDWQDPII